MRASRGACPRGFGRQQSFPAQKFRDRTIFVCGVGERSAVASEMAVALGVKDVVNFRGGTKAWKDAGLPMENTP